MALITIFIYLSARVGLVLTQRIDSQVPVQFLGKCRFEVFRPLHPIQITLHQRSYRLTGSFGAHLE